MERVPVGVEKGLFVPALPPLLEGEEASGRILERGLGSKAAGMIALG